MERVSDADDTFAENVSDFEDAEPEPEADEEQDSE